MDSVWPEHGGSRQTAAAAIRLAISESREEERQLKAEYAANGIRLAAMDFGGEAINSISKIIVRQLK